ncbi:MAG: HAD hydrolase family protein [Planctomycetes bacterium]|nr:HAD hydrolase family protein [Planctomycetota bacterium]
MTRWAIVTDLDGTLLDAANYSFEAARPALEEAARRGVPVVPCTTKTELETKYWLEKLGLKGPCIFENGGGLALPVRDFPDPRPQRATGGDYRIVALAVRGTRLRQGKDLIRSRTSARAVFLSDLPEGEIMKRTGLSLEIAALARRRTYDEPFALEGELPPTLPDELARLGLRLSRGGRFWHLHGDCDKGRATRRLAGWLAEKSGPLRVIGAGDSAVDRPLLEAADVRVAIQKPDGSFDGDLCAGLTHLVKAAAPGPEGWNRAILEIFGAPEPDGAGGV